MSRTSINYLETVPKDLNKKALLHKLSRENDQKTFTKRKLFSVVKDVSIIYRVNRAVVPVMSMVQFTFANNLFGCSLESSL